MLEFFFSSAFFNSVHLMVETITRICIYIFTLGVVAHFIGILLRQSSGSEVHENAYNLFLVAFSAIGLATYKIWAIWIGKIFVLLARAIFDLDDGNIMTEYLGAFFGSPEDSGLRLTFMNLLSLETLSSLSYLMVMIVYEIFVVIQVIVQIFFYLLGPLAIVISLFPGFRDVFKVWLSNFLAVNFWSVLVAILFRLVQTLTTSSSFQASLAAGDSGVLWNSFILGVIISVIIVLIPKLSTAIFKAGSAAADLGSYGTGITAGVVLSTAWKQIKFAGVTGSQQLASRTGAGVISGTQALTNSPTMASNETAMRAMSEGGDGNRHLWPFEGSSVPNNQK